MITLPRIYQNCATLEKLQETCLTFYRLWMIEHSSHFQYKKAESNNLNAMCCDFQNYIITRVPYLNGPVEDKGNMYNWYIKAHTDSYGTVELQIGLNPVVKEKYADM